MSAAPREAELSASVPFPLGPLCVFLDFDGTLVEFAPTPAVVRPDGALVELLRRLAESLDGALAIVSGRSIAQIDAMLAPLRLPVAGLHGLERRTAGHAWYSPHAAPEWIDSLREPLLRHVETHPGLLLEDKGSSLAVHVRGAPQHERITRSVLSGISRALPDDALLLEGDAMFEIRSGAQNKGTAVDAFLQEAGFIDRSPLYIGDDISDGPGMDAVTRRGGMAIAVGHRMPTRFRLSGPTEVRDWLAALIAHLTAR